ncbi:MAG: 16S rRNA (cytidine(1402)-2'-O)-methyltransferase [Oscillospiraceae bacterium]|nr:16S rRNA (cytidine(1402)-2'-O)-methyltransferase [Oscillospiraceae bacterium]
MTIKKSTLYIVGTPIGNLGDLSPRALEVLNGVDFIGAEDTRVTLKLLTKFGVKKPLLACRQHNIREVSRQIVTRLHEGESCAIVTDAGMPCISDPGAELVDLCHAEGVETQVIPGACALVAAVALSGFSCQRFSFEGFLSINPRQRRERLELVKDYDGLLVFYEAPHKLKKTLADLLNTLGDREIALCRELTKIHEEVCRMKLSEAVQKYEEVIPRGEFALVINSPPWRGGGNADGVVTLAEAANIAADLIAQGEKPADACKQAAKQTGLSKSLIYKEYLKGEKL